MYSYVNNTKGQSTTTTTLSREIINGTTYKYVYDALGNITEIQNGSGNALYRYVYDGMSQLISDTDYVNNKKHVYVYDNAGNILKLYNKNLFAYSDNNPIVRVDDGGEWWHIAIAAAIGGLVGAAVELGSQIASGEEINWGKVGVSACAGVLSGAVAGATFNVGASIALNAAINGSASIATQMIDNNGRLDRVNWYSVAEDTCIGAVCGAVGGSGFGNNHLKTASRQLTHRVTNSVKYKGIFKIDLLKKPSVLSPIMLRILKPL